MKGTFTEPYEFTLGERQDEILNNATMVYPNPFRNNLTITLPDTSHDYLITVTDVAGKIVKVMKVSAGTAKTEWKKEDHHALPSGVYMMEIKGGTTYKIIKLIKN
jgi:hypothetical protein